MYHPNNDIRADISTSCMDLKGEGGEGGMYVVGVFFLEGGGGGWQ